MVLLRGTRGPRALRELASVRSRPKAITSRQRSEDVTGLSRIVLQLASQARDVSIDDTALDLSPGPHVPPEIVPRHDRSPPPDERREEPELGRRDAHGLAGAVDHLRGKIDRDGG